MKLHFYYRQQCHLCEDMYELIQPYVIDHNIDLEMFDIDTDAALQKKYTLLVPVLSDHYNQEICHYFFDKVSFEDFLEQ